MAFSSRSVEGEAWRMSFGFHGAPPIAQLPIPGLTLIDDVIVARSARAGDPVAASIWWNRHSAFVRRVLRRILGPSAAAEPLVQKALLGLLEAAEGLEGPSPRTLMLRVLVRICRRELQRRRWRRWLAWARPRTHSRSEPTLGEDDSSRPVELIYEALDELDLQARLAFCLAHFEHLSEAEVASAMQLSLPRALEHLTRARARVPLLLHGLEHPHVANVERRRKRPR